MVLVIGGSYQGKLDFVRKKIQKDAFMPFEMAWGNRDSYEKAWNSHVIYGFHHYIKRMMEEHDYGMEAIYRYIKEIMEKNPGAVIVMDEVGCGIVPVSPDDRAYREAVGGAGQMLAKEADQVYRVICGIGSRIK